MKGSISIMCGNKKIDLPLLREAIIPAAMLANIFKFLW